MAKRTQKEWEAELEWARENGHAVYERQVMGVLGIQPEPEPPAPDTLAEDAMDVGGEFASSFNRNLLSGLDYVGPGAVNAISKTANHYLGTDLPQVPTLMDAFNQTPGAQGGFMDEGLGRDIVQGAGGASAALPSMANVSRNLASPAGAAMEWFGLGAARPQNTVAPLTGTLAGESPGPLFGEMTESRQQVFL